MTEAFLACHAAISTQLKSGHVVLAVFTQWCTECDVQPELFGFLFGACRVVVRGECVHSVPIGCHDWIFFTLSPAG